MIYNIYNTTKKLLWGFSIAFLSLSCEDLVDVDMPSTTFMDRATVYEDAGTAEAALRGVYESMQRTSNLFYEGGFNGSQAALGLASGELYHPQANNAILLQYEENNILADNSYVQGIWQSLYSLIYQANVLMENTENSNTLSNDLKNQLVGEALFIRAKSHFDLLNLFGAVPLVTTSDYTLNANIPRTPVEDIYIQVETDLIKSLDLLPNVYPGNGQRIRANNSVVKALLARVYLYQEKWEKGVVMANEVISDELYELVELNNITVANNRESIWQLPPWLSRSGNNLATGEGIFFGTSFYLNYFSTLKSDFLNNFEPGDLRESEWIRLDPSGLYAPYKYKVNNTGNSRIEYQTIFRLAEQYLIRAECHTHLGELALAIDDVDVIRSRANLPMISETNPTISQTDLLEIIMHERQVELFTEWGHRWHDLKRTGRAVEVLSSIKPEIMQDDLLWPIPQQEINNNPALRGHQNPGY
ncbi:RagB/SusD family nutrient uptake outer membrane protein [Sinomicrobium soli]|uniref:RagB/SusD family nutrient uptake outer membrane protein n=1 Tax=Sinomicrobium sp. N-1-3-6 TaxID=2219864 RepID=UPI000DCE5425|nr:RagB/SusD family nutrient uptake outer membrane protein [Sinomicrobium sp. N-1-3-6]RAV29192.1 RagB/SusD family nutrient uptake outer membrane protein [Sinomicrobium sp. N-1-3-6]